MPTEVLTEVFGFGEFGFGTGLFGTVFGARFFMPTPMLDDDGLDEIYHVFELVLLGFDP